MGKRLDGIPDLLHGVLTSHPMQQDSNDPQAYAPYGDTKRKATERVAAWLRARDERASRRLVRRTGRMRVITTRATINV